MKLTNQHPTGEGNEPWELDIPDWKMSMYLCEYIGEDDDDEDNEIDIGLFDPSITLKGIKKANSVLTSLRMIDDSRRKFPELRTFEEIRNALYAFVRAGHIKNMFDDRIVKWLCIDTEVLEFVRKLDKIKSLYSSLNRPIYQLDFASRRICSDDYSFVWGDISLYTFVVWNNHNLHIRAYTSIDARKLYIHETNYTDYVFFARKHGAHSLGMFIEKGQNEMIEVWYNVFCTENNEGLPVENCLDELNKIEDPETRRKLIRLFQGE